MFKFIKRGIGMNARLKTALRQAWILITELVHREITGIVPRAESFILAASDDYVKGTMIVGINPDAEARFMGLNQKVISGEYLASDNSEVLVTEGLGQYLRLGVGDTIVFIGQGYQGASAVAKYPIKGLVKFGSPDLNQGLVYLPLAQFQDMFGADQRLTANVLMLKDIEQSEPVALQVAGSGWGGV